MKRFFLFLILLSTFLAACKAAQSDQTDASVKGEPPAATTAEEVINVKAGVVRLRLKPPTSEQFACVVPIQLENGLENSTQVTMIGFQVIGPGDDASANMFAPRAEAGEVTVARVIVQGQGCDAFDTLSIPEIRCTSGEEDCAAKVELIDGGGLRFARAG